MIKTNFRLVEFNEDLDLNDFYDSAAKRGFENNSSQKVMIDCFKRERKYNAWILYDDKVACGAIVCHTLDVMGTDAYRICARTCFFPDHNPVKGLYTKRNLINQHQHATPQIMMPESMLWAGLDKEFYITTNDSPIASQRVVHRTWCPEMEKMSVLKKHTVLEYRGHTQTFWKLDNQRFLDDLNKYPRWDYQV